LGDRENKVAMMQLKVTEEFIFILGVLYASYNSMFDTRSIHVGFMVDKVVLV
jgi:hypothetical protein